MSQPQAPKYRKWCATFQNPDPMWHHPKENFIKEMCSMVPDISKIVWAYEMGNEPVGKKNPAYVRGEATGGNLHYQIYFETSKQYRQTAMMQHLPEFWVEWSYAPKSALNYACKADHTLIEGPWSWDNGKGGQGTRNDLNEVAEAVKNGANYYSLQLAGQHHAVLAKHKNYVRELEVMRDIDRNPVDWSKIIYHGHQMNAPDPAVKKRHWWIIGNASQAKTYDISELFRGMRKFWIGSRGENRWEHYRDEEVIIYDDVPHDFAELSSVSNTISVMIPLPGKIRYVGQFFKKDSCRNIIVLTNKKIENMGFSEEHLEPMRERFIVIDIRPIAPYVMMSQKEICKRGECKHVEGECPININNDF